MKNCKTHSFFKSGDAGNATNYGSISPLPVFLKNLERIIYNRIYKHLKINNLLFDKEFGFQLHNSVDLAILKLVN